MESRLAAPLSARMVALAELRPGMRVLDVATGRGEPAIPAARAVGPTGRVVGFDRSAESLDIARRKVASEGLANLALIEADAVTLAGLPDGRFDAVLARWCLMYLDDPRAALRGLAARMEPGAPVVAAVWAELDRVAYLALPRRALEAVRTGTPALPSATSYGVPGRLEADLEEAGLAVSHAEDMEVPVFESDDPALLVEWARLFGGVPEARELPPGGAKRWEAELLALAEPLRVGSAWRLGGTTRLVVAHAKRA
ncbi:MAG: methyltransferase domain-containing protein [Alphaproteobacteria bacterium]|nr:methyltransferase domain-containing protein [Alphaproteobacteria bacterium]